MRLELATFNVRDVRFAKHSTFDSGVLSVHRDELRNLLLEDKNLKSVTIDLARPGQNTRIVHILDTLEPRIKLSGGTIFPGFLGAPLTVGSGRTNRLSGLSIMETATL